MNTWDKWPDGTFELNNINNYIKYKWLKHSN